MHVYVHLIVYMVALMCYNRALIMEIRPDYSWTYVHVRIYVCTYMYVQLYYTFVHAYVRMHVYTTTYT